MYEFSVKPVKTRKIFTKNRIIQTDIPNPETVETILNCQKNEPNSMNDQLPLVWDSAINYSIFDKSGNKWIDFTSCIFVSNVGHSNPEVKKSIIDRVNRNLLNAYYYPTDERSEFSKLLIDITPNIFDKVLFLSTGSEANEAALKMSMKYTGKKKVISFINAYHGKTLGSALVCGKLKIQNWIPVQTHVTHLEYPDTFLLKKKQLNGEELFNEQFSIINPHDFAAVIIEPYQGWSAEFASESYMKLLRKWCTENKVLLVIDEVQSGFGRTGKLFAYEHFDIIPDIIVCAKGISSSLPLSCVISRSEIVNTDMSYNSTHGGNPVAVAASNASVNYLINNNLVTESERKGKILETELLKWKNEMPNYISKINCKGLLAGIFINSPDNNNVDFVDRIIEIAMRKGLLSIRTQAGTIKIGPPLTIDDDALIEGVEVLKESLKECLDTLELL